MPFRVLVSAGEASGDLYASRLVETLRKRWPETEFFGCAGPRMRNARVRPVVRAESLAVVGLVEVLAHVPRIYAEYRKLVREARLLRPDLAILTDSPDFHLRIARQLKRSGVPVIYLVAPQVWAWRKGRLGAMRRTVDRLLCIFPFEEKFFQEHGIAASFIGHPLLGLVRCSMAKSEFFGKHKLDPGRPLIAVLPGSRKGEAARHLPALLEAVQRLAAERTANFLLPASPTTGREFFQSRIAGSPIRVIEGETWDAIAHADLALAASGTVTMEAALLGTPMVIFYRVTRATWALGRWMVSVPFYSMVNLVAERQVAPELIQSDMTGERLAAEARRVLDDAALRLRMREDLREVAARLDAGGDAIERAAAIVEQFAREQVGHVS